MPAPPTHNSLERVYLGTWQFENVDEETAATIIAVSEEVGVNCFDTARVYASGRAEYLLGRYCSKAATIVTKIPAIDRKAPSYREAYPEAYAIEQIEASLQALSRVPTTVLLHNWGETWEGVDTDQIESLHKHIALLGIQHFGVSLPNQYDGHLEDSAYFALFDTVELPYNPSTPSIDAKRVREIARSKTVLARSLFQHGKDKENIAGKMNSALNTGASIVVGATKPDQIREWKKEIQ